ncbi:MAG: RNA polymerase-binding protein DksA [Alphaproteobacteria bacterium]|nr:RNA polymerase-binding protein DksA [Alphaproteobacteria bacterium]
MAKQDYKTIELAPKYVPKKSEPYMCPEHLAYFYQLLSAQRDEIMHQNASALNSISVANKTNANITGDDSDIAVAEQENTMTLRMAERDNKLLVKINNALERIEKGTFGYSVISGDEIGLSRMLARPLATMTIEEQEEHEKKEL